MQSPSTRRTATTPVTVTRALLTCGALAGPLYLVVSLTQALTRPGFDFTRHPISVLSNGALGWIQIANLMVTGTLVVAFALGMRRLWRGQRGGTWGPRLIGVYGVSLIGAGVFVADPALGFPVGTPADANTVSWHGTMHFVVGGVGFLALIAACFVVARRFATLKERGWGRFSVITGVVFFAGFAGIASGAGNSVTLLGFWIAVVVVWAWLVALSLRLRRDLPNA